MVDAHTADAGGGRMNREEAFKYFNDLYQYVTTKDGIEAYQIALSVLRGPQPDPITGLVPCGCGGKPRIKHDGPYSSRCIVKNADGTVQYKGATVLYPGHTSAWVDCDNNKCECSVGYSGGLIFKTDEEARDAWNRVMGYRGDAMRGYSQENQQPKHWCSHCWDFAQTGVKYVVAVEDNRGIQYPTKRDIPYNYCPSCGRKLKG